MLFLQAKFGFTAAQAGQFYGFFLAGVYFMPLIGGILADKFGYGKMVTLGIVVMFLGYLLMAVPASGSVAMVSLIGALVLICVGTGLFKGNLQVMVGNLYDDPRYSAKRDSAFSIFYMAINIGAMYAPSAATAIANWQPEEKRFLLRRQHTLASQRIPQESGYRRRRGLQAGDPRRRSGMDGQHRRFRKFLHRRSGRFIPHGIRGSLLLARGFHGHLPRFQEDLQTCRRNLQAAGSTGRRPWRKGCGA